MLIVSSPWETGKLNGRPWRSPWQSFIFNPIIPHTAFQVTLNHLHVVEATRILC